jgi:hypothetical protein
MQLFRALYCDKARLINGLLFQVKVLHWIDVVILEVIAQDRKQNLLWPRTKLVIECEHVSNSSALLGRP